MSAVGNCDLRYAKILGTHWEPETAEPGGMERCCRKYANGFEVSYWMCMNLCSLCCKKLIIDFECGDEVSGPVSPNDDGTIDSGPRNYNSTAPTDSGIKFSSSAYGIPLPIVFGSDKLQGNVFWASPVRRVVNAGVSYQTVDFALGLCEGEINGLLKMWLAERLIMDNSVDVDVSDVIQPNNDGFIAGRQIDFTDPEGPLKNVASSVKTTRISVFNGGETQLPEGIMAAREGYDNVPAYRGVAYILFENFIVSDSSIPALFAEITSNTENSFPRLYGNNATTPEVFDRPNGDLVIVDPSYDLVHVACVDSNGTATPANGEGFAVFDNNLMSLLSETEIDVTTSTNVSYGVTRLLPSTGFLMVHNIVGNAGTLRVWNPFTQTFVDTFGPGGSVSDHNLATGLSALYNGSLAFVGIDPLTGKPIDVFAGVGLANGSIGFVTVTESGQMDFVSNLSNIMPKDDARCVVTSFSRKFEEETQATFIDGGATFGQHMFAIVGDQNENDEFTVLRIILNDETYSLAAPQTVTMDTLPVDDIAGDGIGHTIQQVLVDPVDRNLVIFFQTTSASDIVVKYNPFTGAVVWRTSIGEFPTVQGYDSAYLIGQKYAWIANNGNGIFSIDFATGVMTTLADLVSDESLPVPFGGAQFYNGAENTITYTANTTNQRIVKVYLERITRSTIELSDITKLLLRRIGLLSTDISVEDLTALTLNGYTINEKQSLRACFAELGQVFKYDVIESNGRIKYKTRGETATETISHRYLGDVNDTGWLQAQDTNDISRIRKINLKYRDIDREYRDNVQSILLPRYGSQSFDNDAAIDVDVPVVLESVNAKKLAEILLYAKLTYDTTYTMRLPQRYMNLDPGDVIDLTMEDGETKTVRLRKTTIGADRVVEVEASQEDPDIYNDVVNLFGNVGRYEDSIFPEIPARVDVLLMDIPFISEAHAAETQNTYYMYVTFLNNRASAFVETDVGLSLNGVDPYTVKKPTRFPTWGYVTNPPEFRENLFSYDETSQLRVRLMNTGNSALETVAYADILASKSVNLCYVGGELLQFTSATDEGNDIWLLTGLLRARLGTEPVAGTGTAGDKFVLIGDADGVLDTGAIRRVEIPSGDTKHAAQFFLRTPNPLQPNPIYFYNAMNLRAFPVADLNMVYNVDDVDITWQRCTRYNGEWPDDGDETVPINELDESYVIYLHTDLDLFSSTDPASYLRRVEVTTDSFTYTLAMQTEDGFDNTVDTLFITMYQQGGVENYRTGTARSDFLEHK